MEKDHRDRLLKRVPTRKLLASIKKDLRRVIRASASASKPKKK
jgi:hypothetical protein